MRMEVTKFTARVSIEDKERYRLIFSISSLF